MGTEGQDRVARTYTPSQTPRAPMDVIRFRVEKPGARLRLFCFHHAGGSALLYRTYVPL